MLISLKLSLARYLFKYIRTALFKNQFISIVSAAILCIGFTSFSVAQTKLGSNEKTVSPTQKLDDANKKVISSPSEAFDLAGEALVLSKAAKNKKAEASSYNTLGTLYYNAGDYNKAIEYFNKAKVIYESVSDSKNEEYALKYLGKSYEALNENEKSLGYYEKAEKKSEISSDKNDYRFNNSKIKRKVGKSDEAIDELEKELKNNKTLNKSQKIDIYLELGDLYLEDKKKDAGVKLINRAIEESNSLDSTSTLADTIQIRTLNTAWGIYEKNGYTDLNFTTQSNALTSGSMVNEKVVNAANYNIGLSYLKTNPALAVPYFEKSAEITKKEPKKIDHIKAVERLSEAYEKSGEYEKALEKYKEYVVLVDSIKQSEIESKLKNELLSSKYRIQETRIAELELKQAEKEAAIKTQRRTILGLVFGIALFFILTYFLVKNIKQKQRSNTLIQLASLRSQMNPHFIFNSLNSVNGFISNNDEIKANRYISDFSKLMRTVLNNSNSPTVSLSEELNSLGIYLALEHSRFEDKFDYQLEVDAELNTEEIEVPPMLIQPYIENAVWHGLRYKEDKGFLKINMLKEGKHLLVVIEDNGIGRQESQKLKTAHQRDYKSTGIENTKERIRLLNKLHKTHFEVKIIDLVEHGIALGTRVEITLPTNIS